MRLELLIVAIIFLVFFGLNILGDNIQKEKQLIIEEQNSSNNTESNQIDGSEYILKQMTNNSSKQEITNLTNKDELILEEELKEKNKVFIELVNQSQLVNVTN